MEEIFEGNEDPQEDFYSEAYLEEYVENDEIDGLEQGFMMGYLR